MAGSTMLSIPMRLTQPRVLRRNHRTTTSTRLVPSLLQLHGMVGEISGVFRSGSAEASERVLLQHNTAQHPQVFRIVDEPL